MDANIFETLSKG